MAYCTTADFFDTLLSVQDDDVKLATEYVDALAARLGVTTIKTPTPYEVKQLAVAYSYTRRALFLMGKSPRASTEGDAYERKFKQYMTEVDKWEAKITAELLTGTASGGITISIPLYRC